MARRFNTFSLALALVTGGLVAAGCGGDDTASTTPAPAPTATTTSTPSASPTPPTATAPSAPSPPPDAPTATPTGTATGESGQGGGGDEAAARIPVAVTVGADGSVSPAQVSVPAFFALELRVRNRTGGSITVTWNASEPVGNFEVGAGKVGTQRVAGLKRGSYPLAVKGAGTATIVSGAQPGP